MHFSSVAGLVVGYCVYWFSLLPAIALDSNLAMHWHYMPIKVFPYLYAAIGLLFGVYGAHRDGTRLGEYLTASAIYIVLATVVVGFMMASVSLKPLPIGVSLILALGPLLQCVSVGAGYLLFAVWERRDHCPLWRSA